MNLQERINAFSELGNVLHSIEEGDKNDLFRQAVNHNPWFTSNQCETALGGISKFLVKDALQEWTNLYKPEPGSPRKVGVVMAGNIPLVGFHDLLCVLISGHQLAAKLSSQDRILMQYVIDQLVRIDPRFKDQIVLTERMNDAQAVIATGTLLLPARLPDK